jgi:antitoxin component YwqK of YwqJK toxin-antitoxin module
MKKIIIIIGFIMFVLPLFSQNIRDTSYYSNGNKREILSFNSNSQLDGICYAWSENGVLTGIAYYKNGRKHGDWKIWRLDGSLAYEMYYKKGEKIGIWKSYDNQGQITNKKDFN